MVLFILLLIVLSFIYLNFNRCGMEYMDSAPKIFMPEGYGEKGQYYDNSKFSPVYRIIHFPTVFD